MAQLRFGTTSNSGSTQLRVGTQTAYLKPTALQNVTPLPSEYSKLDTGEIVYKSDLEKLAPEQQEILKTQGVEAFNKSEKAKVEKVLAELVKLDTGEYVGKNEYEQLPQDKQTYLKQYGISAFNDKERAEWDKFKESHTQLPSGEWVSSQISNVQKLKTGELVDKSTYESLKVADKQLLDQLGIAGYNQYKEKEAQNEQSITADSRIADIYAAMQRPVAQDILRFKDGSSVSRETWDSLPPDAQKVLMEKGVEGFNEAVQSGSVSFVQVNEAELQATNPVAYEYYKQAVASGKTSAQALEETNRYITASNTQNLVGWANSLPIGSEAQKAFQYALSIGKTAEDAAQYAYDYAVALEKATPITPPVLSVVAPPTQTGAIHNVSDSERVVAGQIVSAPSNTLDIKIKDAELVKGATVDASLVTFYKANIDKIEDVEIAQQLVNTGLYSVEDVNKARIATNQIIKAEKQQVALTKLQPYMREVSLSPQIDDENTIRISKGLQPIPQKQITPDSLAAFLKDNPNDGAKVLLDAGYNRDAVLLLTWNAYKENPLELKTALNNANFTDAEISDYAKSVIQELNYPSMPQYESMPSLHDYVRDYLQSKGKSYLESEIKANVLGLFIVGAGSIALDKDIQTAIAQYSDKYGVDAMLQSGAATTMAVGFEAAREWQPGESWEKNIQDVSFGQWAMSAAQLITAGALPASGTVVGKVLQYAGQAAFGVALAADWNDMTASQRATSIALLVIVSIPDIASAVPKSSTIGKIINKDIFAGVAKEAKAYLTVDDDAYIATKYKQLQNAVVKGDASAIKSVTDEINTYGKWAKANGVTGADDMLEIAGYFNQHADDIASNILKIRESSVGLPKTLVDLYDNLGNVVKKQELAAAKAYGISEHPIAKTEVTIDGNVLRDPITGRILEGESINRISVVVANKNKLLTDIINTGDFSNQLVTHNGVKMTVKEAAQSLNESIGNTVKTQGWAAAEDIFGSELMRAYNPKSGMLVATAREYATEKLPSNIVSRAKANLNATEIQQEFLDNGGISWGASSSTKIKGLVGADGVEISDFTVSDVFNELDRLTKTGKASYIEQPGGFVKVTPLDDMSGYKYIGKDGVYVSSATLESLPAYKNGLIRIVGESYSSLESLRQSIFKPTTAENIEDAIVNSITDHAYTIDASGKVYTLSQAEIATYTMRDIFLDVPASALNEATTLTVSGANISELAVNLASDISQTVAKNGIMAAISKYGVTLVAAVYPNEVSEIITATQNSVMGDIVSEYSIVPASAWNKVKQTVATAVVSLSLIGQLGIAQPIITAGQLPTISQTIISPIAQTEVAALDDYVRLDTGEIITRAEYNQLNNYQQAQINNIGVSDFNILNRTNIMVQTAPITMRQSIGSEVAKYTPKTVAQTLSETIPEVVTQTVAQPTYKTIPQTIPITIPVAIPQAIPQNIPVTIPQEIPQTIPQTISREISETLPKVIPVSVSQMIPETIPQSIVIKLQNGIPLTKKEKKLKAKIEKQQKFKGAIAWKQGFGWVAIKEPYGEDDVAFFYGKYPPRGVITVEGGKGAAYRSIQQYLVDHDMPDLHIKRGIMKIDITKPTKEPGAEGAIKFTTTQRGRPQTDEESVSGDIQIQKVDLSEGEGELWADEKPVVRPSTMPEETQEPQSIQVMPLQPMKQAIVKRKSSAPSGFQLG